MIKRNYIKCTKFLYADADSKMTVNFTAAAFNKLDGITVTAAEYSLMDNMWATVTTTTTDMEDGTADTQFVFYDAAGVQMATPIAGVAYHCAAANGLAPGAMTAAIAIKTNGALTVQDTNTQKYFSFVTTATGLLGITTDTNNTAAYIIFIHPTGKLVASDVISSSG